MLQLTIDSRARYLAALKHVPSKQDMLNLFQPITPKVYPYGLSILKLPKERASDPSWYHVVHTNSGLVIASTGYDNLSNITQSFKKCKWYYLASDVERRTLIALWGNVRMQFNCLLRYETATTIPAIDSV
jgi:hypothetical protein